MASNDTNKKLAQTTGINTSGQLPPNTLNNNAKIQQSISTKYTSK